MNYMKKNFTLIEMLVVIAIICILAGLVFPAVGLVRDKAKMSKAHTECSSLKTAIVSYEAEYACWPCKISGDKDALVADSDYKDMCKRLAGDNTKKITFFEPDAKYDETKGFLDPWENKYQVIVDVDFDNKLDNSTLKTAAQLSSFGAQSYLHSRVAVFSFGVKDGKSSEIEKYVKTGKLISSWK